MSRLSKEKKMRVWHPGVVVAAFLFGSALSAQTPTGGPTPTPTPPPARVYQSDPAIANTDTTNNQRRPSVAVGTDGNYLVAWHSDAAEAGFFDIKAQLFTHDGVKIGSEFQVDQGGPNHAMYTPSVAAGGDGTYVVVWADFLGNPSTDAEVWMRRYDGAANPLAGAVQVNSFTTGRQRAPRVAANDTGQFVVVWGSYGQDGSGFGIFGQRYDENGAPSGGEFAVNTYTTGDQDRPAVNFDGQGFTVAFNDGNTVSAREFGAFLGGGPGQFPVFGADHRLPDVVRLDGASNTLYVAENTATGAIDGVRSEDGAALSPFAIIPGTDGIKANARVAAYTLPAPSSLAATPAGGGSYHSVVIACDAETGLAWHAIAQLLTAEPTLGEVGLPFEIIGSSDEQTVPAVSARGDQIASAAAYVGSGLSAAQGAGDGSGAAVQHVRFGAPNADHGFAPNESAVFAPATPATFGTSPTNLGTDPVSLTGVLSPAVDVLRGPGTTTSVTITDPLANYGTIAPGGVGDCQAQADCYGITLNGPRPGVHWDEAVVETLSTAVHKTWLLHVGESFADVPTTNLFYAFIENLLHNGVTAGGACGGYCPTDGVKRQQMAVFLLKARFGSTFVPPPATGTIFTDVTLANPFASWIETLFLLGVTGGCSGGPPPAPIQFCPDAIVNRQQMAVFLLKMLEGSTYVPPAPTGIFQDVPDTNPFRPWIEELYNRQVTGGCVVVPLQYCPANPTNRQQMAAFLVKTFGLLLYGP